MTAYSVAASKCRKWESCKLTAYQDSGGVWTIGWGSTGKGIGPGTVWTQEQADARFEADINKVVDGVRKLLTRSATDNQLGAMASLAYNIGIGRFTNSTLLRLFNAGNIAGAAKQFSVWVYIKGVRSQGLANRRADERELFESDEE